MMVKKISINPEKIIIDIVLCPKTKLYLQSLYCHRCAYFKSDEGANINCNYKKPQITISDHQKEDLIKIFSKIREKKESSSQQLENNRKNDESMRNIEILKIDLLREIKKRKNSMSI